MKYKTLGLVFSVMVVATAGVSQAQVTATGQGRGSFASLLQIPLGLLITADTGPQSAVEPNMFSVTAAGATVNLPGVAAVVSSTSSTAGAPAGKNSAVISVGGEATADVASGLIKIATTESQASVSCDRLTASGGVTVLTIAGSEIPILENTPPNTTINVPGVALVVINRQGLSIDPASGTVIVTVDSAFVQVLNGTGLELSLSTAAASLANLPRDCPIFGGPSGAPNLSRSNKTAAFLVDGMNKGFADPGDQLRFTIHAENSGNAIAPGVVIIDRLPLETTFNANSVRLNSNPVLFTVANCPSNVSFVGCAGEPAVDLTRQCLTVAVGDLAPGGIADVTFDVTVNQNLTRNVCNTAFVGDRPVMTIVPKPRELRTTGGGGGSGGGGCALQPGTSSGEAWPVCLLTLLWGIHQWHRRKRVS